MAPRRTPPAPRVVAVVAARNEERTVAETVRALLDAPGVSEVVVADDGSSDRTAELARDAGARVLVHRTGVGKGGAMEAALDAAGPADAVLFVDADTGGTAAGAVVLLAPVLGGEADLAIGTLPPQAGAGLGAVRRLSAWLVRRLGGLELPAPMSGQRAVSGRALPALRPLASGFGVETGMGIDAGRLGLRVAQFPVDMRHRPTGRTLRGFAHRGRQGLDALRAAGLRAVRLR